MFGNDLVVSRPSCKHALVSDCAELLLELVLKLPVCGPLARVLISIHVWKLMHLIKTVNRALLILKGRFLHLYLFILPTEHGGNA